MEQLQIPYFPNSNEFSNYTDPSDFKYKPRHAYYEFLKILPTVGQKEIQRAILSAFKRYHPDSGNYHPKEFEKLIQVKEFLTDPHLKKIYDRTGFTKENLVEATAQITGEIIQCAVQGANSFEIAKEVIIDFHQKEIQKQKGTKAEHQHSIGKINKMIDDMQSSSISDLVIVNLNQEIRVLNAKIAVAEDEIEVHVSLCWLINSMYGKTPTPMAIFDSLSVGTSGSSTATNSGVTYNVVY